MRVAARAVQARLNADHSDYVGPHAPCALGPPARFAGRRDKDFTTVLGDMTLSRAYYHCDPCEATRFSVSMTAPSRRGAHQVRTDPVGAASTRNACWRQIKAPAITP